MKLHITGTLELFIDYVVHAAAGINEAGGQDGQATPLGGVAGGTEETLRRVEGRWVNAAGKSTAAGWYGQIIGPGETGDAVKKYQNILTALYQALGPFQC